MPRLYRLMSASDESLELAVRSSVAAGSLLEQLGLSRAGRARVFAEHRLSREGRPLAPHGLLAPGDVVRLALAGAEPLWPDCPAAPVVWEDPCGLALVADKPQGLLVHGDGSGRLTLTDRVQAHLASTGRIRCAQAVQRIDTDTSGCVLFSLCEEFQPAWDAQVAQGALEKTYLAVVAGNPAWSERWVDVPVGRDRHDARRMRAGAGKEARTGLTVVDRDHAPGVGPVSLLRVRLATGRRHQIRVHAAYLGFPLLGDVLYGGRAWPEGLMLHAWSQAFQHPVTQQRVRVEAPAPSRFLALFPSLETMEPSG